jgi:pimeloyl-ACP methyl ester carboxylesterase
MLGTVPPVATTPLAALEAATVGPATLLPEFIEGFDHGRRFGLWVLPGRGARQVGSLLVVQPFGDEANLSRRVIVAQAMRLAQRGWTTLVLDLYGTGDSDGATDQASLGAWRADLLRASRLVRERAPGRHVVWGIRLGALLAAELALALDQIADGYVFWQAPASGAAALDTLLKLAQVGSVAREKAVAAAGGTSGAARTGGASEPSGLPGPGRPAGSPSSARGGDGVEAESGLVDLGGYRLPGKLVADLSALRMHVPPLGTGGAGCPVLFLGVQRNAGAGMPAPKALSELVQRWLAAGYLAALRVTAGEPFWSSMEPSTPLGAFEATEAFLAELDARA